MAIELGRLPYEMEELTPSELSEMLAGYAIRAAEQERLMKQR